MSLLAFSCEGNFSFTGENASPHFEDSLDEIKKKDDKDKNPDAKIASPSDQSGSFAAPRLSQREYENVVRQIFEIKDLATSRLPSDVAEPFDTQQKAKEANNVFVEGFESMAFEIAKVSANDPAWILKTAGCNPSSVDDRTCIEALASNLGYLLWRTKLSETEISTLVDPSMALAKDADDTQYAIRFVIAGLLQSPRFVYRVEIGVEEDGLARLTNEELVTKLSFLLWSQSPDKELLAQADGDALTSDDLKVLATEMLEDPRAVEQIKTFHEMWFGYKHLNAPEEIESALIKETDALLERVFVTEKLPWKTLFLSDETFVDPDLAKHYGMADIESEEWVKYQNKDRAGLLSHGSILSLSARDIVDTSVTGRGKEIATAFLCRTIDPPPPGLVTKKPVATADSCKSQAYIDISLAGGTCASCHAQMDPIGFGMERFDGLGKYREIEYGNENCDIEGTGSVAGMGAFSGPKQLAEMMLDSGELTECAVQQMLTFSRGQYGSDDVELKKRLHEVFLESDQDFNALILAFVSDPTFRFRKDVK